MRNKYEPYQFRVWLDRIDLKSISEDEAIRLSSIDLNKDADVIKLTREIIKPDYLKWNERNRHEMLDILSQAQHWDRAELKTFFDDMDFPGAQVINDPVHFIDLLAKEILG